MPLLNDAKTCYFGTTPITSIYAGTQIVWPKGPKALELRAVKSRANAGPTVNLAVEFKEHNNCADCSCMRTTYKFRYTVNGVWGNWVDFRGGIVNGTPALAYCVIAQVGTIDMQGQSFELSVNGITTDSLVIDENNAPEVIVYPSFNC